MKTNSKEYWEKRFNTKDWETNLGKEQTDYFAKVFCDNCPEWLIKDINESNLSITDIGCAEGDALDVLARTFSVAISGIDFSESAIKNAQNNYPNYNFMVGDINNLKDSFDVAYVSNVLEHFNKPFEILNKLFKSVNNYAIIMVPFNEKSENNEHEYKFTLNNIPIFLDSARLIYLDIIDCCQVETFYNENQAILIYSKDTNRKHNLNVSESFRIVDKIFSKSYEDLYNELEDTKSNLINELRVTKKLMNTIDKCNNEIITLKSEKNEIIDINNNLIIENDKNKEIIEKMVCEAEKFKEINNILVKDKEKLLNDYNEINDKNKVLTAQFNGIKDELNNLKDKYDNLYKYSCIRDGEYSNILNSRSYQVFNKYIKPPMKLAYRISHKFYRIFKSLSTLNYDQLKTELVSPFKKIINRLTGLINRKKIFKKISNDMKGQRVIILPPTLDWTMPLFQRPQQLALAYSRKDNTKVIYMTKNIQYDNIAVAENVANCLWVVNEKYLDRLGKSLSTAKETILSLSWTPNKFYFDRIKPDKLIYEYIDELEIFHMYGPEMENDHNELMSKANVTVCTATKLYNQVINKARNPIVSTNAGDYDFFSKTVDYEISDLIKDKIKGYKCVLGYYGALAKWFDYELVKETAKRHPEWVWILVGINYDKTLDSSGIKEFDNIVYIPPQPYKELPKFLKAFDIATIPFCINEITLSTSPVKLFEYMAGGKPIIASKMPECLKYKSVKTYKDIDELCLYVEEFITMNEKDEYWTILDHDARANTWDAKTDEILNNLYK